MVTLKFSKYKNGSKLTLVIIMVIRADGWEAFVIEEYAGNYHITRNIHVRKILFGFGF